MSEHELPRLPMVFREYATLARADARRMFRRAPVDLRRAWGLIMCQDAEGERWTLLGDADFTRALAAAETPVSDLPADYDPGPFAHRFPPAGKGVGGARMADFPLDELRPQWAIREWPDRWPSVGRLYVIPWRALAGGR